MVGLYDRALAVARIEAAVEAARALDRPFVITGRTEVLVELGVRRVSLGGSLYRAQV